MIYLYKTTGGIMKTILIVEDDKNINEMLQKVLKNAGYNIKSAYSGTEALLLHNDKIDLILLDLMLPGKVVKKS